jgi:hypothetical protein
MDGSCQGWADAFVGLAASDKIATRGGKLTQECEHSAGHSAQKQKTQPRELGLRFEMRPTYGLVVWMEWLPCGTAASATGFAPVG